MGKVAAQLKVMPQSPEIDLDEVRVQLQDRGTLAALESALERTLTRWVGRLQNRWF